MRNDLGALKISFILLMLTTSGTHAQTKDWIVLFDGESTAHASGRKSGLKIKSGVL